MRYLPYGRRCSREASAEQTASSFVSQIAFAVR
jgi:hypothetical protein